MTIYKKRVNETLSNEKTVTNLERFENSSAIEGEKKESRLSKFLNVLKESPSDFKITPDQSSFLESEDNSKKISLPQDNKGDWKNAYLLRPSLYDGDRLFSKNNFQYTVRILEKFTEGQNREDSVTKVIRFYKISEKDNPNFESQKEQITKASQYIYPDTGDIPSATQIRGEIDNLDKELGGGEKESREDFSNIKDDIERLAVRIYQLQKNDREKSILRQDQTNYVENLHQAVINAISDDPDKSPRQIDIDGDTRNKSTTLLNAFLDTFEDGKEPSIDNLSAKSIVKIFNPNQEQQQRREQTKTKPVTITNNRVTDIAGNVVNPIYDSDGNVLQI